MNTPLAPFSGPSGEPSGSCGVETQVTVHDEHGTDLIGQPILFATGQFTGRVIRAELREIQKADLGRKYAKVDRRPLDPPPVIQLSLFEVYNHGTNDEFEEEVDYDHFQPHGVLCMVDLFPVQSSPVDLSGDSLHVPAPSISHGAPQEAAGSSGRVIQASPSSSSRQHTRRKSRNHGHPYALTASSATSTLAPRPTRQQRSDSISSQFNESIGNAAVPERSKQTHLLVGQTFVQPSVIDYRGRKTIFFVFADLAVKTEGQFLLRYRAFDLTSCPEGRKEIAVQAQCYGGSFRVYSTKEFPGLQPSTDLTKHLAQMGIRLNTRETERRRNKRSIDSVDAVGLDLESSRIKRQHHDGPDRGTEDA